jgi:hypothetical protein
LLAKELNSIAEIHDNNAPIKVFVIERIASLLLATSNNWQVTVYDPFKLPFSDAKVSRERNGLVQLDALKIAFANNGRHEYLKLFNDIRNLLEKKLGS